MVGFGCDWNLHSCPFRALPPIDDAHKSLSHRNTAPPPQPSRDQLQRGGFERAAAAGVGGFLQREEAVRCAAAVLIYLFNSHSAIMDPI